MKQNRSLWLPTAFVLIPISLAYLYGAWFGISMGLSMPWSTHVSLIMSDRNSMEVILSPIILAVIMLLGAFINIKIAKDIGKLNKLFLVLLALIATLILIKHVVMTPVEISLTDVLAMWSTVSVIVAWLIQRYTTKKWQMNS